MDFNGKKILITGSSRGIGRATAAELSLRGAVVAVNGRSGETVEAALAAIEPSSALYPVVGDVGTPDGCRQVVEAAVGQMGGLDVLVNAAGVWSPRSIADSDEAFWDRMIDVNLKGTYFCIREALPALRASGGNVVNVSSDAGLKGLKYNSVYCASKAGVVNMTRALALELAPEVRVNCVCPGYVDTDMVRRDYLERSPDPAQAEREAAAYAPLGRMATAGEIAKAVAYLASSAAAYVTGSTLQIDGGSTAG